MSRPSKQITHAPSLDVTGKKVVVVGGKVGIGLGIARAARAAGASRLQAGALARPRTIRNSPALRRWCSTSATSGRFAPRSS